MFGRRKRSRFVYNHQAGEAFQITSLGRLVVDYQLTQTLRVKLLVEIEESVVLFGGLMFIQFCLFFSFKIFFS